MVMELTVIGCSSGMPSGEKSTSSYLLDVNGKQYLLDCGDGTASSFQRLEKDPNDIDVIFISHMHADHSMGLPLMIQMMHLTKREKPLTIYVPKEAEDGFKRLLYMTYLFPEKLNFDYVFKPIEDGSEFSDDRVKVSFKQNSHLYGNQEYIMSRTIPNRMHCFSMIVQQEDRKLVYSADIGELKDLDTIAVNADLLLTEGMHLDLEKLPQFCIDKKVKKLILTHLPDNTDITELNGMFVKQGFENVDFAATGLLVSI